MSSVSADYILYVLPNDKGSNRAIDIVRLSNLNVHFQDVTKIQRPVWLDGVPILAQRQSGFIWKGSHALNQLKYLTQNIVLSDSREAFQNSATQSVSSSQSQPPWNNYQPNLNLNTSAPPVPVTNVPQPVMPQVVQPQNPQHPTSYSTYTPSPSNSSYPSYKSYPNAPGVEVRPPGHSYPTQPTPSAPPVPQKKDPNRVLPLPPPDGGDVKVNLPPPIEGFKREAKTSLPTIPETTTEPTTTTTTTVSTTNLPAPRSMNNPSTHVIPVSSFTSDDHTTTRDPERDFVPTVVPGTPEPPISATSPTPNHQTSLPVSQPPAQYPTRRSRRVSKNPELQAKYGESRTKYGFTPKQLEQVESLREDVKNNEIETRRNTIVIPDTVEDVPVGEKNDEQENSKQSYEALPVPQIPVKTQSTRKNASRAIDVPDRSPHALTIEKDDSA